MRREVIQKIGKHFEEVDGVLYQNASVLNFDGHKYVLSHRAILTIVVASACNAACTFCSNEITFTPFGKPLLWSESLRRVKAFAQLGGIKKVAYSGGEPTLNPAALLELVSNMNPGFTRSRIHTNGFGLFHTVDTGAGQIELLPALIRQGLTGASVSVAHHDPAINDLVMQFPRSWSGMTEDDLRRVTAHASDRFTPRLSCVLTDEGVTGVSDMLEYMRWGRSLGFRRFIFRSCSTIPDEYKKNTSFSTYNDANIRAIDTLSRELESKDGIDRIFRQRKSDSKVDVYQWGDVTFDVDESSEEVDPDAKIRRLNVMPDGVCYTSWIDPTSNLFIEDAEARRVSMKRAGPVRVALRRRNEVTA